MTDAPCCAAAIRAVSTSLERSQALKQIVFAFGRMVLKNVEATLVSVPSCVAADCAQAVSTNVAPLDADGDGDGDAEIDGEGAGEAVGSVAELE